MLKLLAKCPVITLVFCIASTSLQVHANLSAPKPYHEQPKAVQKAIKPEIQIHSNQLKWSLDQSAVDGNILVDVVLTTLNNFHLYENKVSFSLPIEIQNFWDLSVISKPATIKFFDPVTKSLVNGYSGQALFRISLSPKNVKAVQLAESESLSLIASFQACSESVCLFPTNLILNVKILTNTTKKQFSENDSFFSQSYLQNILSKELGKSWIAFLILFFAGILTAFTPCVYPMYPITIGIFTNWSQQNPKQGFLLSLYYCLGITLTYSIFGLITAATGTVFGTIAQSPWFLIGIGSILLISGILFSGIISFSLPSSLINCVSNDKNSKLGPSARSFVYGASLGLVASPCVGPVLIGVLSWTSALISSNTDNAYILGFSYLSVFGLGMCIPFLVLATLLIRFQYSPSLGAWTPWIKKIGTILLIASSLYFLVPGIKYLKLQNEYSDDTSKEFPYAVYEYETAPKDKALLIDFRADWCAACIEIENKTLKSAAVTEYFKTQNAALVKVDMTVLTEKNQAIAKRYGVLSLPALIFINSKGETCTELMTFEFINSDDLLQKLNACK